jgi:hypothetical protein
MNNEQIVLELVDSIIRPEYEVIATVGEPGNSSSLDVFEWRSIIISNEHNSNDYAGPLMGVYVRYDKDIGRVRVYSTSKVSCWAKRWQHSKNFDPADPDLASKLKVAIIQCHEAAKHRGSDSRLGRVPSGRTPPSRAL